MAESLYDLMPLFCVRMAGFGFERLESLGTTKASAEARKVLELERELDKLVVLASDELRQTREGYPSKDRGKISRALEIRGPLPSVASGKPAFDAYSRHVSQLAERRASLQQTLEAELQVAGNNCERHAREVLPGLAVFGSDSFFEDVERLKAETSQMKPSVARQRWRSFATYLQRVCAKNETFSDYGPQSWGRVTDNVVGASFELVPGVGRRSVVIETAYTRALVAAINADPTLKNDLRPRLNPLGRLEGHVFCFEDSGTSVELDADDVALLSRCDGKTRAGNLDATSRLERLAQERVILWMLEPVGMDMSPLQTLFDDVQAWADSDAKSRWLARLGNIDTIRRDFAEQSDPATRRQLMKAATKLLDEVGAAIPQRTRELYAATQPIQEEVERAGPHQVGRRAVEALMPDLTPWADLFRDTNSLACTMAFRALETLHRSAPRRNGRLTLAAFMAHCERGGASLNGAFFSDIGARALELVSKTFKAALSAREPSAAEWVLTTDDCHAVRRKLDFVHVDEYAYPSVDLQVAATSVQAALDGDLEWIISEFHQERALIPFYRECIDRGVLKDAYKKLSRGKPMLQYIGLFTAPVHISHEPIMYVNPDPTISTHHRTKASWPYVAPSMAEVVIDEANHDIRVVDPSRKKDLGSFLRVPRLSSGFHPWVPLYMTPHTPRLRIGKTVVQRRMWFVRAEELDGKFESVSSDLVLAVERLRAARDLPRWVYVRPMQEEGRATKTLGRDKDAKPICVDLESYISLEVMVRHIKDHAALQVVEMSPVPEQMLPLDAEGPRSFELRTMVVPR